MKHVLHSLAAGLALLLAVPSQAQAPAAQAAPVYEVAGFRSARFGMGDAEVRRAIAADFPAATVTALDNPAEGTRVLVASVPHLTPAPGGADVSYVFGARSGRLMHVNVSWAADAPDAAAREQLAIAALQLARYFGEYTWPATARDRLQADGTMLAFAGRDAKGAAVELTARGLPVAFGAPPPAGPARLQISYMANTGRPDVARVRAGAP